MSGADGTSSTSSTVMNRRALLRASGVAAGIAGIGGLVTAEAPAAGAAAGDPVLMSATNDAGSSSTLLRSNEYTPTMILVNTGPGAPLRLREQRPPLASEGSGDLMNADGELQFGHGNYQLGSVFTSTNATRLVPVRPTRVVDTRTAAGRANLVDPARHLDSAGRLIGGQTIDIDLGRSLVFRGTAVFANLTVTQSQADGYLTVWPDGTRPGTSMLNYTAGQTVANFCVSGLHLDRIRLYAKSTTHVLLDVVAFAVGSPSDINASLLPNSGTPTRASSAAGASSKG